MYVYLLTPMWIFVLGVCFQVLFDKSVSYRIACHEHHARLLQRTVILHTYLLVEEKVQRLPPHQLGHTHLDMIEKGFNLYSWWLWGLTKQLRPEL